MAMTPGKSLGRHQVKAATVDVCVPATVDDKLVAAGGKSRGR
jgi:hypothetical protein